MFQLFGFYCNLGAQKSEVWTSSLYIYIYQCTTLPEFWYLWDRRSTRSCRTSTLHSRTQLAPRSHRQAVFEMGRSESEVLCRGLQLEQS